MKTDYINLGAIGFAQLGSADYYAKKTVEKKVIQEILLTDYFEVPKQLDGICWVGVKSFPYEGDSYNEAVLYFDSDTIEDWENEDENSEELHENLKCFHDFMHKLESYDWNTQELLDKCQSLFSLENPMKIIHKKDLEPEQKLKSV